MIPVTIETLVVGGPNESKIILRPIMDTSSNPQVISIYLDMGEALALSIAAQKKPEDTPRDDLALKAIHALGGHFSRALITGVNEQDFISYIVIQANGEDIKIEAKACDAITLAIKAKAPMYVDPEVFDQVGAPLVPDATSLDALEFHKFVNELDPDDFMSESDLDDLLNADSVDDLLDNN